VTPDETERAVIRAIENHLRGDVRREALAWLRARVDAYKALERLN
jgi:hypothetical protein